MDHSNTPQVSDAKLILPETGYIRIKEVVKFIPVSKSTWWKGVKSGRFPQSVKLSERITAWHVDDIKKYIQSFIKA